LFTTFSDNTLDGKRFFQASKRQVPPLSANSHPSVQNRSTLQLIYQLRDAGNWAECSTESASIIECWVQGSIMNHDRFPDELVLRVHCTLEMEIDAMGGTSSCLRREYAVSICSKLLGRASRDGFPVGKQEALVRHGNPFVA